MPRRRNQRVTGATPRRSGAPGSAVDPAAVQGLLDGVAEVGGRVGRGPAPAVPRQEGGEAGPVRLPRPAAGECLVAGAVGETGGLKESSSAPKTQAAAKKDDDE